MDLRFYEVVFIARQDLVASQVEAITKRITEIVQGFKGEVAKTEFCGLRGLAYPIKKNKKGHYVLLSVGITAEGLAELERRMRIDEDILRYLTVRVDQLDNTPSALMQQKHYREGIRSYDEHDFEPLVQGKQEEATQ